MDRLWGQAKPASTEADTRRPGVSYAQACERSLVGVSTMERDPMDKLPALVVTIAVAAVGLAPRLAILPGRAIARCLTFAAGRGEGCIRAHPASVRVAKS